MSSTSATQVDQVSPLNENANAAVAKPGSDMSAFLGTLAALLRETIARFEQTTGRVSDMVIAHTGRADPDLVVALQDFDRLQQEFSALGEVLSRMQVTTNGPWPSSVPPADLEHELLKTVTIADLKLRLSQHFEHAVVDEPVPADVELLAEF
ncbi:MAG: hypothetical protein ACXWJW_01230 [Xanthobacteraceae bacterium]